MTHPTENDAPPDMSCEHEPPCRYFWRPCVTPSVVGDASTPGGAS